MYCTYSKGDIGKISPVVSQTCNYNVLQPLEHEKTLLVNYSNCFLRIIMHCMYSKENIGKISLVVRQPGH